MNVVETVISNPKVHEDRAVADEKMDSTIKPTTVKPIYGKEKKSHHHIKVITKVAEDPKVVSTLQKAGQIKPSIEEKTVSLNGSSVETKSSKKTMEKKATSFERDSQGFITIY